MDYSKLTKSELLEKYAKVRETLLDLNLVQKKLEEHLLPMIEYGDEPTFWDDYRLSKTLREVWTFPDHVESLRKIQKKRAKEVLDVVKVAEAQAIKAGEAVKEEVYGFQFSIKGRKAK